MISIVKIGEHLGLIWRHRWITHRGCVFQQFFLLQKLENYTTEALERLFH